MGSMPLDWAMGFGKGSKSHAGEWQTTEPYYGKYV